MPPEELDPNAQPDPNADPSQLPVDPAADPLAAQDQAPSDSDQEDALAQLKGIQRQKGRDDLNIASMQKGLDDLRRMVLTDVFTFLRQAGIDPNDPKALEHFLRKLGEQDPDFVTLFRSALDTVMPNKPNLKPMGGYRNAKRLMDNVPTPGPVVSDVNALPPDMGGSPPDMGAMPDMGMPAL